MALVGHNQQYITQRVNNKIIGNTILGQMARYRNLIHIQTFGMEDRVQVVVDVDYYAVDANDNLLQKIETSGITSYVVNLIADNSTLVDAQTGEIVAVRDGQSDTDWTALANSFTQDVDFQGNFFNKIAFNVPVTIAPLIQHHIQNANTLGKFNQ